MGEELLIEAKKITISFDDMERYIVGKDIQPKGTVKITAPIMQHLAKSFSEEKLM